MVIVKKEIKAFKVIHENYRIERELKTVDKLTVVLTNEMSLVHDQ